MCKGKQQIDLVIKLEDWKKEADYDRLGLEEEYAEYLGNKVVCHSLPIRPGRNLAVIVETAAVNHRQKRWATMQLRSCIAVSRQILQKFGGIINHGNRKEKRLGEISPGT